MILEALAGAALAVVGIYLYAAAALWTHARLATLAPPRTLAHAVAIGALVPACGCTAMPYARRAPERLRAPFLVAAYAANPLLLVAAALIGGWAAAAVVLALALVAAFVARLLPPGERPRTRLDDLLLRRDGAPMRDAIPYVAAFGAPALAFGALVGLSALAPALVGGLALAALALLLSPRPRDLAEDHGRAFAVRTFALHVLFAGLAGSAVWVLTG